MCASFFFESLASSSKGQRMPPSLRKKAVGEGRWGGGEVEKSMWLGWLVTRPSLSSVS